MHNRYVYVRGDTLSTTLQDEAKRCYVNRFTGEHRPEWADTRRRDGKPYNVQFRDDTEWLANTYFPTRKDGGLGLAGAESYPTFPYNPEDRRGAFDPSKYAVLPQ